MHTTVSDGILSPTQLVDMVGQRGLHVMALTDHDTTAGLQEAFAAKQKYPQLTLIPGIELSCDIPGNEVHVLGYFIDDSDPGFQQTLADFRSQRLDRGQLMVQKLRALGMDITWERVLEIASGGDNSVGRPHIAAALLEKGYVKDNKEAFDRFLSRTGPAYAERTKMAPREAVDLIRSVGGLAVLAHPKELLGELDTLLDDLCGAGLAGMEAHYQGYPQEMVQHLLDICQRRNLVPCGGSDFHGIQGRDELRPGDVDVPMSTAERLFALAEQVQG
jgi:predicted metal-dependent phosphoesterase TrpH